MEKGTRSGSGAQVWHLNVHYSPFFNGVGGFFAGSAERPGGVLWKCRSPGAPTGLWGVGGQAARRGVAAGGLFFSRIPPWHTYLARFSRVRAAMRTAPGACKVGPDDTDELRE
eukprot:gene8782-biopygen15194